MKILVTGACGFVGSALIRALLERAEGFSFVGIDNFSRPGSETNRLALQKLGVSLYHGDVRVPADLEALPKTDWVIDAAANPSVIAGTSGVASSRQVVDQNLIGVINVLEYCKRSGAGLTLLSTSRIYSIPGLLSLEYEEDGGAFRPKQNQKIAGLTTNGIREDFSTTPPLSLYGATKLAAEIMTLELGALWQIPVAVLRCGVIAGAGQFGRPDQGIFSFWIHSYLYKRPLRYIGFGGSGNQVRDCVHPRDLASLIQIQISKALPGAPRPLNVSGSIENSMSLSQLSAWCESRFGKHEIGPDPEPRTYDVPWLVLDSAAAAKIYNWRPQVSLEEILKEIAQHADEHPNWLELSGGDRP